MSVVTSRESGNAALHDVRSRCLRCPEENLTHRGVAPPHHSSTWRGWGSACGEGVEVGAAEDWKVARGEVIGFVLVSASARSPGTAHPRAQCWGRGDLIGELGRGRRR